jgi:amidase
VRPARGELLSALDGIPYTAKDSYAVRGHTLAAGSPAFRDLIASDDAFTIDRLRHAGAIYLGRTNMPPMANGGMQRGLYGRAESPYNPAFLTAAFGSGSSNGSGTATAASFASFGLGEETWSSGRAPAANNGLVAYTPSRGVISVRGNWPLVPTMDVVVPHTRTVNDMLDVLEVIVQDDPIAGGDFWRAQTWVRLPRASEVRPASYPALGGIGRLDGVRLGVPAMYINQDTAAREPILTRQSIIDLWETARADLTALGAEVVDVELPVVSRYERDRPGAQSMVDRGLVPDGFADRELWDLSALWWDIHLGLYAASEPRRLADVDGELIFPRPSGALPDRYGDDDFSFVEYVRRAREGLTPLEGIPLIAEGVAGLEVARREDFEQWLAAEGLDGIVFPAVADVAPSDADVNPVSADIAWRNGTWVANGNLVWRHLGIPTVTVPMGTMADIGMPAGLTFAGPAYSDSRLLDVAAAFEAIRPRRVVPRRTPRIGGQRGGRVTVDARPVDDAEPLGVDVLVDADDAERIEVRVRGSRAIRALRVTVSGSPVDLVDTAPRVYTARARVELNPPHSEWLDPYGAMIVAFVEDVSGAAAGAFTTVGGTAGVDGPDLPPDATGGSADRR